MTNLIQFFENQIEQENKGNDKQAEQKRAYVLANDMSGQNFH
jgi:hypothetical protein